jgi:hypothetical protein
MRLHTKAVNLVSTLSPQQSGVQATLSLTKPNNQVVSKLILTDQSGIASAQFMLGRSDKAGTYQGAVSLLVDGNVIYDQTSIVVR